MTQPLNYYRYRLGLWYYKNNKEFKGVLREHGNLKVHDTFKHILYVAQSDSVYDLMERAADLRCLNDATCDLYNFVVWDSRKQKSVPMKIELDARDRKAWRVSVEFNNLTTLFEYELTSMREEGEENV